LECCCAAFVLVRVLLLLLMPLFVVPFRRLVLVVVFVEVLVVLPNFVVRCDTDEVVDGKYFKESLRGVNDDATGEVPLIVVVGVVLSVDVEMYEDGVIVVVVIILGDDNGDGDIAMTVVLFDACCCGGEDADLILFLLSEDRVGL
jgi:hypothetical protein